VQFLKRKKEKKKKQIEKEKSEENADKSSLSVTNAISSYSKQSKSFRSQLIENESEKLKMQKEFNDLMKEMVNPSKVSTPTVQTDNHNNVVTDWDQEVADFIFDQENEELKDKLTFGKNKWGKNLVQVMKSAKKKKLDK